MREALVCVAAGTLFGLVLGWARLTDPAVLDAMLRLREPFVFLVMGSGIATAAIGVRLLRGARARTWIGGEPVSWKTLPATRDHALGGALFGLGWSLSCICPGPAAALTGRGDLAGPLTFLGLLLGIAARDATRASPHPAPATSGAAPAELAPEARIGL